MIISHTFEAGTSLQDKRHWLCYHAMNYLGILASTNPNILLLGSLINLRLKGTKCSIEFTEEFKR